MAVPSMGPVLKQLGNQGQFGNPELVELVRATYELRPLMGIRLNLFNRRHHKQHPLQEPCR